jgi:hypothetical protein
MSQEREAAKEVGMRTGRDPVVLAAAGSVLLAWYQFFIQGNKLQGLFVGLWPPTMLAFSNAIRINDINRKVESKTRNLIDRITESGTR